MLLIFHSFVQTVEQAGSKGDTDYIQPCCSNDTDPASRTTHSSNKNELKLLVHIWSKPSSKNRSIESWLGMSDLYALALRLYPIKMVQSKTALKAKRDIAWSWLSESAWQSLMRAHAGLCASCHPLAFHPGEPQSSSSGPLALLVFVSTIQGTIQGPRQTQRVLALSLIFIFKKQWIMQCFHLLLALSFHVCFTWE